MQWQEPAVMRASQRNATHPGFARALCDFVVDRITTDTDHDVRLRNERENLLEHAFRAAPHYQPVVRDENAQRRQVDRRPAHAMPAGGSGSAAFDRDIGMSAARSVAVSSCRQAAT